MNNTYIKESNNDDTDDINNIVKDNPKSVLSQEFGNPKRTKLDDDDDDCINSRGSAFDLNSTMGESFGTRVLGESRHSHNDAKRNIKGILTIIE